MISVNYTSPSMLFRPFWKKKLINEIACAYSTNDHDPSACKYFIAVKRVSFFLLTYGKEVWN